MGLQSKLFRGDPKLEAAAISDPAHIMLGASGPHVSKIQTALILLDGATISADEVQRTYYGATTAAAVLAYKQKRNIINRNYQTQADNIVGKMTMASLDREMLKWEALPHAPVRIKPLTFWYLSPPRSPALLALLHGPRPLGLNFAIGSGAIGTPHILPGPNTVLEIPPFGTGTFEVIDGRGGTVMINDPNIAEIRDPAEPLAHAGERFSVSRDRHLFNVVSFFKTFGRTVIIARSPDFSPDFPHSPTTQAFLDVAVRKPPTPTPFVTATPHNHMPCRNWPAIQAHPNSAFWEDLACKTNDPQGVADHAISNQFDDKPIALRHLRWYLTRGKGEDFVEDDNIMDWLKRDVGIRNALKFEIFQRHPGNVKTRGNFEFPIGSSAKLKADYTVADFEFSFGTIDRVDFEVDLGKDTVHVWFQDRYEFHPVFPGLYEFKPGDEVRPTNCVHAAMVELKDSGAQDFWMKGEAVMPLTLISGP